ncbi:MAG TPA: thermonuclease family protein [Planctomycetaceae bacterium]|jgi:endonuclease YncB( thermonuclease family)|nr:thermonuclease family protein [Planctomycetaceae bacterium]
MAVLYLAVPIPAYAAKPHYELTGKVVKIADGDTLTILDADKEQRKIRLAGIDAPEKGQPFRTKAREALGKVFGQTVRVEIGITGKSGASFLGERFVNMEMVRDGFAWRYVTYDKPGQFTAAEADAREHHRGLWADKDSVPPWEWRREKRRGQKTQ